jgi:hypothetical protein
LEVLVYLPSNSSLVDPYKVRIRIVRVNRQAMLFDSSNDDKLAYDWAFVPFDEQIPTDEEERLKYIHRRREVWNQSCNVGDFLVFSDQPNVAWVRVRGGFRKATDEEMALIIAFGLG